MNHIFSEILTVKKHWGNSTIQGIQSKNLEKNLSDFHASFKNLQY